MYSKLKKLLYFPIAYYFRFFAFIQLKIWRPRIFVITGSSGKTTLLHLIESQLGDKARYSHKANSSFGIPFDILGLKRETLSKLEWPMLFLKAPLIAFKKPFSQKMYVVEADCDRPFEGQFLGSFLKPEVTLWLDVSKTHTVNFGGEAKETGLSIEETVAHEFGYFGEFSQKLVLVNGDDEEILKQVKRFKAETKQIKLKDLDSYKVEKNGTQFKISNEIYKFSQLLPKETFYAIAGAVELLKYLEQETDPSFPEFELPPGRSSLFKGIKGTYLIDSSYNSNLSSMQAILEMFVQYPADKKWAVLSDMTELGEEEEVEHQKLAQIISECELEKVILMGPRMKKYTLEKLQEISKVEVLAFDKPKEVLDFLEENIKGGETILFKGARFLEGVIEHLLLNKSDVSKLPRREAVWEKRRKDWGL